MEQAPAPDGRRFGLQRWWAMRPASDAAGVLMPERNITPGAVTSEEDRRNL
jgi:hypothetical protein